MTTATAQDADLASHGTEQPPSDWSEARSALPVGLVGGQFEASAAPSASSDAALANGLAPLAMSDDVPKRLLPVKAPMTFSRNPVMSRNPMPTFSRNPVVPTKAVTDHGSPGTSDAEGHPSASSAASSRGHDGGRGGRRRAGRGGAAFSAEDMVGSVPSLDLGIVAGECPSRAASDHGDEPEEMSLQPTPRDMLGSMPEAPSSMLEVVAGSWAGGWERAFRHDDDLLRACGFWCKRVEADGACLFRAFSDQLEGDGGFRHLEFRKTCVAFLEAHRNEFAPFVEGSFKGYCSRLREPTAWGGHVEAQALSRALGVNTLIHMPAEAQLPDDVPGLGVEVLNFAEDAPCVQLCFHPRYHSGPHYNSVRCLGDSGDGIPAVANLHELRQRMVEALKARREKTAGS